MIIKKKTLAKIPNKMNWAKFLLTIMIQRALKRRLSSKLRKILNNIYHNVLFFLWSNRCNSSKILTPLYRSTPILYQSYRDKMTTLQSCFQSLRILEPSPQSVCRKLSTSASTQRITFWKNEKKKNKEIYEILW